MLSRNEILEKLENIKHSVSDLKIFEPELLNYFRSRCDNFKAGRVARFLQNWEEITSNKEILSCISGTKIEFETAPTQHAFHHTNFSTEESDIISDEMKKLKSKGMIEPAEHELGEIISRIFLCPKKDGSHRLILNLEELNKSMVYHHFNMDTLNTIINLMQKDAYMASVDLKDAYYLVKVDEKFRKYLWFWWEGQLYQFMCLPNGLSSALRLFTKLLKPPLTTLHKNNHISSGYIDDLYLQGATYDECVVNVIDTITLLEKLGFVIHPGKSALIPSQQLVTLGFILNSIDMTIRLTQEKKTSLRNSCEQLLQSTEITIRELSQVIGKIVASFLGVMHGPLYYRNLERDKTVTLMYNKGNFEAKLGLSEEAKSELHWWINHIEKAYNVIAHGKPNLTITTDTSKTGWGAVCGHISTGGHWSHMEAHNHINILELVAAYLGMQTFAKRKTNSHIRIKIDNTTAVSVINRMGTSHSTACNAIGKNIWEWGVNQNIWMSAAHRIQKGS